MIKIGMIIGDRYEVLEKIGTGGMSDVYKAKCHKLNRFVAVKVLKQEFSENSNFVSKFRVEAQAAAGLMHPNIVNVYDVGEENGVYYIVMELVEGITLKKYIEKKARLSYKEAISVAIQVGMGIEAAHNNHIIHRDIKPQNIIISKDGKVKVTDFGIAKAASSNTITSNVMGSVHYTSPEQARGGYSDEKSDIYSLGISLFEMLTGRVPFNGETTVAIAIKHIQEEMPSPKEYIPEIPASVEGIVMKCCQKSPDRRYQSVAELIMDLKQSLLSPDEDFVIRSDPDADASTRMITDNDMAQIKRHSGNRNISEWVEEEYEYEYYENDSEEYAGEYAEDHHSNYQGDYSEDHSNDYQNTYSNGNSGNYQGGYSGEHIDDYPDDYPAEEGEEDDEEAEEYEYDDNPKMQKITTVFAIVIGVLICVVIVFLVIRVFDGFGSDPEDTSVPSEDQEAEEIEQMEMPDVIGMSREAAQEALDRRNLRWEVEYIESESVAEGIVIETDISSGTMVDQGTRVKLTISSGTQAVEVPDVSGKTYEEAETMLSSAGFLLNRVESYSSDIERGRVITQNPIGGSRAPKDTMVVVTISLGEEEKKSYVPNLIGMTEEDAIILLTENRLRVEGVEHVHNTEIEEGKVCYQSHSHGSYVAEDTGIAIRISLGSGAVTYRYNADIGAPTQEEAPGYVAGTDIGLRLTTDEGVVLLDTTVNYFPQNVNYFGISSGAGTLHFRYTVTLEGTTTTNPDTGETEVTPGGTEDREFTRRVEFAQE